MHLLLATVESLYIKVYGREPFSFLLFFPIATSLLCTFHLRWSNIATYYFVHSVYVACIEVVLTFYTGLHIASKCLGGGLSILLK